MKKSKKLLLFAVCFFLVGAIIIPMSVENWGLLAKSADDSETIEEAIDRIVAEHEADPAAHLGAGESLEAHRANEVIDHPAGSVVSDKVNFRELNFVAEAVDLNTWPHTGFEDKEYQWPIVHTYLGNSNGEFWDFYNPNDYLDGMKAVGSSFNFRWILKIVNIDTLAGGVGIGYNRAMGGIGDCFVGFKIENGVAKANYVTDYTGGTETWEGDPVAVNDDDFHYYFVNYIVEENVFRFYIDGDLVGEYEPEHALENSYLLAVVDLTSDGSDYADIYLRKFEYSLLN